LCGDYTKNLALSYANAYISYLTLDINTRCTPLSQVARGEIEQFRPDNKKPGFRQVFLFVEVVGIEPTSEKVLIKHLQA
jgi:hypothetical protein